MSREVYVNKEQDQAFISVHLQADQFCKSFTTHLRSLNSKDLLLAILAYVEH